MTTLEILSAARSAKRAVALADSETRRRDHPRCAGQ